MGPDLTGLINECSAFPAKAVAALAKIRSRPCAIGGRRVWACVGCLLWVVPRHQPHAEKQTLASPLHTGPSEGLVGGHRCPLPREVKLTSCGPRFASSKAREERAFHYGAIWQSLSNCCPTSPLSQRGRANPSWRGLLSSLILRTWSMLGGDWGNRGFVIWRSVSFGRLAKKIAKTATGSPCVNQSGRA